MLLGHLIDLSLTLFVGVGVGSVGSSIVVGVGVGVEVGSAYLLHLFVFKSHLYPYGHGFSYPHFFSKFGSSVGVGFGASLLSQYPFLQTSFEVQSLSFSHSVDLFFTVEDLTHLLVTLLQVYPSMQRTLTQGIKALGWLSGAFGDTDPLPDIFRETK